jgi:hypothetical protein
LIILKAREVQKHSCKQMTKKRARKQVDGEKVWNIKGLPATRPNSKLAKKLSLFGQFVGNWDILDQRFPESDKINEMRRTGEVHFNWILDGRAIQDVWGPTDPKTGKLIPVGTTLRFYDTKLDAWRSTWISPMQREVRRFIGRKIGNEIVLQEEHRGLRTERWFFSEIKRNSFRWHAVRRKRIGGPWCIVEEMHLQRRKIT